MPSHSPHQLSVIAAVTITVTYALPTLTAITAYLLAFHAIGALRLAGLGLASKPLAGYALAGFALTGLAKCTVTTVIDIFSVGLQSSNRRSQLCDMSAFYFQTRSIIGDSCAIAPCSFRNCTIKRHLHHSPKPAPHTAQIR